ncbi:DUF192 domain-containing protein [Sphingomonas alpina]|uniref:DUF192 domain-containing protein n=1 Tax=Sphingomonas alpina TaxID=653931 RepID=A0A7H0LLE8_9SPHN|nr:DUF192 domain-containing protein [Sphingomonas alpina]QNQ10501.1 DUF192 domain-containing protein [Sphingomonas alpina]
MAGTRSWIAAVAFGAIVLAGGCTRGDAVSTSGEAAAATVVTVKSSNGAHVFKVDLADTEAEQQKGLMYRTGIPKDGGMLFAPYPPNGGAPREASFWMKNTPSTLDIIFIRADGTIAHIAENTVPFSEAPVPSGEPVGAVLEINGGRALELGIVEGDAVSWTGKK